MGDTVLMDRKDRDQKSALSAFQRDKMAEGDPLAHFESNFERVFANSREAFFLLKKETLVACNSKALKILGGADRQVIGENLFRFFPNHQPDGTHSTRAFRMKMDAALRGEPQFFRWTHLRCNGTPFEAEMGLTLIVLEGEMVIQGLLRDITERAKTEHVLKDNEKRFRELADLLPQMISELDEEGNFTFVNMNSYTTTGYTREDFQRGVNVFQILAPEEHDRARKNIAKALQGERVEGNEYILVKKDGSRFPALTYSSPIVRGNRVVGLRSVVIDITERKRAEEKYRTLFETMAQGVIYRNERGTIISVNPAAERILGLAPDSIGECTSFNPKLKIVHEDGRDCPLDERPGAIALKTGKEVSNVVLGIMNPATGRHRWVKVHAVPWFREQEKKPYMVYTTFEEITEQKEAEKRLRESEQRFRDISEAAGEYIWETDRFGIHTYVSDKVSSVKGYMPEELLGHTAFEYMPAEDAVRVKKALGEAIMQRRPFRLVHRDITRTGDVLWEEVSGIPIFDLNGRFAGCRGAGLNITNRKKTEDSLREAEEKYRNIFMNAAQGIFQTTPEGHMLSVNPAMAHIHGYRSPEEMLASVTDLGQRLYVNPEDRAQCVELLEQRGVVKGFEAQLYRKDGSTFWCSLNFHAVRNINGRILYYEGTAEDITSRRAADEELKRTMGKLSDSLAGTIRAMSLTVETRDPYTSGHQKRVSSLAYAIARELGTPKDTLDNIRMAGIVHDIGKISVPAEILSKPTKLRDVEYGLIKLHAQSGYNILKEAGLPYPIAETVLQHHERIDGSGYPQGLRGDQILLEARVLAVADVVEAIASHRPYRPGLGIETALEEIAKNRDILYDRRVVDVCIRLFRADGFRFDEAQDSNTNRDHP